MIQAYDRLLLRIGLVSAGALLLWTAFQMRNLASVPDLGAYGFMVIALGGTGLLLLVAAGMRTPSPRLRWLIVGAVLVEMTLTAFLWRDIQARNYNSVVDTALYTRLASELVQRGENPYAWDFNYAHELYRSRQETSTPKLDGSVTRTYPYPTLSFLLVAPLDMAGLPGEWLIRTLAQAIIAGLIFLAAPRTIQSVILLPFMAWAGGLSNLTGIGANDAVWAMLIVAMIIAWRRPSARALLYGLAISYKQAPWLLAPFLLVRLWRDEDQDESNRARLQRVARFAIISNSVFLITNLPYLLWNPPGWLEGVLSPITSKLVYLSQGGLSGLTAFGYINLSKDFYLLATLLVLSVMIVTYWRHYARLRDIFIIMPAILMWFSYRTLITYWFYWVFPTLALIITRPPPLRSSNRVPYFGTQTLIIAMSAIVFLFAAGTLMTTKPSIVIEPQPPYRTVDGQIQKMLVRVTNRSASVFVPRFSVQHVQTALNPLPWYIEAGPQVLQSGESALYQISNFGQLTFSASSAGQVIVTDARGNYDLRDVAIIGPDKSFLWPDAIPNPEFLYWDRSATTPIFWEVRARPFGIGGANFARKDGRNNAHLTIDDTVPGSKRLELMTFIIMPREPFGIWVYPDFDTVGTADYGIEFEEGGRRLILRFGTQDRIVRESVDHVIIERAVPHRAWSYQAFDLPALYTQAGWDVPPLRPFVLRNIDADFRAVSMILYLSSDRAASVYFGPIEQADYGLAPTTIMAETLADPVAYYGRLADRYIVERNFDRALVALERAAVIEPDDTALEQRIIDLRLFIETADLP